MVTVDDKKYACETCIKGHRSSACKHTDRPLFEIKKKGRPITQCEHCRELRKTKQVHVKCSCGSVPSSSGTAHEGSSKLPHAATFPNGLPKELEAKVGSPVLHSDGSESEFSGDQSSVSACKCGPNQCHCCVPRKSVSKRRMSGTSRVDHPQAAADLLSPVSPLSSHVQARIAELRPVMPRPPRQTSGPLHNPSAGTPHGYGGRNHAHDFSPYGRAYEQSFSETPSNPAPSSAQVPFPPNVDPQLFTNASDQLPPQIAFPSACTCGDGCQCPGCTQHSKSPAPSGAAFSSCCNPITCSFCLDCTIFSMPPEALLEPSQTREIDTWLQQLPLSSPNSFSPTSQIPSPPLPQAPSPSVLPNIPVPRCRTADGSCTCLPGACFCPITCCQDFCPNRALSAAQPQMAHPIPSNQHQAPRSSAPRPSIRVPDYMSMTSLTNVQQPSATQMYSASSGSYYSPNAPSRSSSRSSASSFASGPALPGAGSSSRQPSGFSPISMPGSTPHSGSQSTGQGLQQQQPQHQPSQQQNQPPYQGYYQNDMSRRY